MDKIIITHLATKADIQRLEKSTKADTHTLKTEFKRSEKSLRGEILRVEERVENLEDGQKRIEGKLDQVINTLDSFVGKVEKLETENEIGAHHVRELGI